MKRIISILLILSLSLAFLASCDDRVEGYDGYLEYFNKKAERVNEFDEADIAEYGSMIAYFGSTFEAYITNMFFAVMEDGKNVRCVELVTDLDARQYATIRGNAPGNPYCYVDGNIVLHGTSDIIESFAD